MSGEHDGDDVGELIEGAKVGIVVGYFVGIDDG